jgi:hypothetical protein
MQAVMVRFGKLRVLGRYEGSNGCSKSSRSENNNSLEQKFDSGWLSLHVLSIP